jgi:type III pantothenate kinase
LIRQRLLIDAGNSRVKWTTVAGEARWLEQGVADYAALEELVRATVPDMRIIVASVAKPEQEAKLLAALGVRRESVHWLSSARAGGGVQNGYVSPERLGVDRWLGLIAARRRTSDAVMVVSAGTALVMDALTAEGRFPGGTIQPGLALMRRALAEGMPRLTKLPGSVVDFPRKSEDAIESGTVMALCASIERRYAMLCDQAAAAVHCLVTGGDASYLLPYLSMPCEYVPALVLEGMDWITREELPS